MLGVIGGDFGGEGRVTVEDGYSLWSLRGKWEHTEKPTQTPMTLYSQNNPRWRDIEFAPGVPFGGERGAGCYVCCVAMIASIAGSTEEPPQVADELRRVGCFHEDDPALLSYPEKIPDAYPLLEFCGWYNWHKEHADKDLFFEELGNGPVITEVDFRPTTRTFNQHFVVSLEWNEERNDVLIADPWDGRRCFLLERYRLVWYALSISKPFETAICGMRLLRVK